MLALRAIWLGFLSLLLWAIVTALTGTWWVGLLAAWALLAYGIVTGVSRYAQQREAQWQEVQRTYREYLAAKASADAAAAEAAAAAAEAEVAQAQIRLMREHPELFK
ncbi:hypothetical protein BST44_22805 [Mycobacterium scrofulaceum]|uniref:Uncharacterized protein n=2 Tax=Mycobacterium scrofulaceum TaxID=1783 RepID=A0A1X0K8N5_MYCSC|nr:hypothetical protein BST44_22805 [Mycobacterium scrofulaceum]